MHYLKTYLVLAPLLIIGFIGWRMLLNDTTRRWANFRMCPLVLLPGVGLLAPSLWIYYAAILACMILLPRSRIEAIGLFILLALMLPLSNFDLSAGTTLLLKLDTSQILAVGLLFSLRFPGDKGRQASAWSEFDTAFLLMFALLVVIAARVVNTSITTGLRELARYALALGVPYWILSRAPIERTDIRRLLHYVAMAGFILSVEATFEILRHWPLFQSIDTNLGTSRSLSKTLAVRAGLMRAPGPFYESTSFGVFLALATTIMAAQGSLFRSAAAQWAAVAVCCLGTFSTLARNGWIGLLLGLFFLGVYRGRLVQTFAASVAAAALVGIAVVASPSSDMVASLIGESGHAAATADYRENLLKYSIPIIEDNPIIGMRYDDVRSIMYSNLRSRNLSVDYVNSYLYFTVVSGVIGLYIFAIFKISALFFLLKIRKKNNYYNYIIDVKSSIFSCIVSLAFMLIFTSYSERIPLLEIMLVAFTHQLKMRLARGTRTQSASRPLLLTQHHNPPRSTLHRPPLRTRLRSPYP